MLSLVRQVSEDGSVKYLLRYPNGTSCPSALACQLATSFRSALLHKPDCAMGCAFCATGLLNLQLSFCERDLQQVMHVDILTRVTSVVLMGQTSLHELRRYSRGYGTSPTPLTEPALVHAILRFLPAVLYL